MFEAGIFEEGNFKTLLKTSCQSKAIAVAKEVCCFKKIDTYFKDGKEITVYDFKTIEKKYELSNDKRERQMKRIYEKRGKEL